MREIDTGISPNVVSIIQKNLRLFKESEETAFRMARELGPWSARAAVVNESSVIVTSIPVALCLSQSKFGSALVIRNLFLDNRWMVPSSITFPNSSHQGVYIT